MMEWIEKIHFELEYKIRDGFGGDIKKIPFSIKINNLLDLRNKEIQSREEFDKKFSGVAYRPH